MITVVEFKKIVRVPEPKISTSKTKTVVFKGRDPVRSKIVMNNNIIEKTNTSNNRGCSTSYQNEKNILLLGYQNFSI